MTVDLAIDHLWQSTLVASALALLTLVFRRAHAQARYSIWLAASLKFLIPFAALTSLGAPLEWGAALRQASPEWTTAIEAVRQPLATPPGRLRASTNDSGDDGHSSCRDCQRHLGDRLPDRARRLARAVAAGVESGSCRRPHHIRDVPTTPSRLSLPRPRYQWSPPTPLWNQVSSASCTRYCCGLARSTCDWTMRRCARCWRTNWRTFTGATTLQRRCTCSSRPSSGSIRWSGGSAHDWWTNASARATNTS